MFYRETAVGGELSALIKCIWILERDYRGPFPDHEHLWADANGELIFTFGSPYYQQKGSRKTALSDRFVIGPFTKSFDLHSDGVTSLVGVRFFPWGFYALSKLPMADLVDRILPAEHVFGSAIGVLASRLVMQSHDDRVAIVHDFLRASMRDARGKESTVDAIGMKIIAEKGRLPITALASQFAITPRKLERLFRAQTGLSAKLLSRIVRFNYAKHLMQQDPDVELVELSMEVGYSDQAHFSKTFKEMFGITPGTFKRQVASAKALIAETQPTVVFLQD